MLESLVSVELNYRLDGNTHVKFMPIGIRNNKCLWTHVFDPEIKTFGFTIVICNL